MGEERLSDQISVHASYPLNSYVLQISNDLLVYCFILLPILYLYFSEFDKSFIGPYFVILSIIILLPLSLFLFRNIYNFIHWLISTEKNQDMAKLESIYFISKNEIIHPIKFVQFISSTGEKIEIKPHLDFKRIGLLQDDFCQQLEFEMILLDLDQTHQIQYDETIIEFQLLKDNKYIAKNIKRYNRLIIELQSEYYLNPDMVQSRRIFHERKFQEKYNEKLEDYVPVTWKDYKFVYQIIAIAIMFLVILPELNIPPGFAYIIPLVFRIVLSLSPVVLVILLYIPEKIKESEVVKINNM